MTRISFLNGQFVAHKEAYIHIDDRAMQFADSIYEVILFHKNQLIDNTPHLNRLEYSLNKLEIQLPYSKDELTQFAHELFKRNNITSGSIYIQITRGVAPRNQIIPQEIKSTVIMTVSKLNLPELNDNVQTKVMLEPDIRWQMCDVKSTGLLIGTLYKSKAQSLGFDDVIMHRDNIVTECCFSNLFIVKNNQLITHPTNNFILAGITRATIIKLAQKNNIEVVEREFTTQELPTADEVFTTSTTTFVRPIHMVNNSIIYEGKTGPIAKLLFNAYLNYIN